MLYAKINQSILFFMLDQVLTFSLRDLLFILKFLFVYTLNLNFYILIKYFLKDLVQNFHQNYIYYY